MIRSKILREIQLPMNSSPTNHLLGLTQTPKNLEQETADHKIDEKQDQSKQIATKLFTGHNKGVGEHTLRDHRPISTQTSGKLDHGQEHEIHSISSCSTRFNQIHLRGSIKLMS